jgi:hypothetical protein
MAVARGRRRDRRRRRRLLPRAGRAGEPVIRIGPVRGLVGIDQSRADLAGQQRKLMTAALADGGEWHRVPDQIQGDLIGLPGSIATCHSGNGQQRTINAP